MPQPYEPEVVIRNLQGEIDFFGLAEKRRRTIKPLLNKVTLNTLASVACLEDSGLIGLQPISADVERATWKTEGIFWFNRDAIKQTEDGGVLPILTIDRSGNFFLLMLFFRYEGSEPGTQRERAWSLGLPKEDMDLQKMCGAAQVKPADICDAIKATLDGWIGRRKKQLAQLERVAESFLIEDLIIAELNK